MTAYSENFPLVLPTVAICGFLYGPFNEGDRGDFKAPTVPMLHKLVVEALSESTQ